MPQVTKNIQSNRRGICEKKNTWNSTKNTRLQSHILTHRRQCTRSIETLQNRDNKVIAKLHCTHTYTHRQCTATKKNISSEATSLDLLNVRMHHRHRCKSSMSAWVKNETTSFELFSLCIYYYDNKWCAKICSVSTMIHADMSIGQKKMSGWLSDFVGESEPKPAECTT